MKYTVNRGKMIPPSLPSLEVAIRVAYEEEPWRIKDILDHIGEDQSKCKTWLVDNMPIFGKGIVVGGWYGMLANYLGYASLDIDPKCSYYGKVLYPNVEFIVDDAFNHLMECRYDMVVNTACEHMKQEDLDMFNYLPDTWFALQSNNWEGVSGHINCKSSLEEFASEYDFDFLYKGEMDMGGYKRWTIVGKGKLSELTG